MSLWYRRHFQCRFEGSRAAALVARLYLTSGSNPSTTGNLNDESPL